MNFYHILVHDAFLEAKSYISFGISADVNSRNSERSSAEFLCFTQKCLFYTKMNFLLNSRKVEMPYKR